MKVGAENRPKLIAAIVLMAVAVIVVGQWMFSSQSAPAAAAPARPSDNALALSQSNLADVPTAKVPHKKVSAARSLDPTLRYDWLKQSEDTEYKGSGRNIFQAQVTPPKPISNGSTDHRAAANVPPPVPAGPPPPPPIELKFYGFASSPGQTKKVFLSQGEDIFIAGEGEIIDRRYKVLRISPSSVEIEDVLNNNRQEIPLSQG